ncbi:MAG: PQQ-binding-like beta-propeller repeat protein, partial [Thermoguttaceae bacterium]
DLPQWGYNTPAIWDDAVFVTSHVDDHDLLLLKIDKKTGKIQWTRHVGEGSAPRKAVITKVGDERRHQKFHPDNNLASPSPVTDGEVVVVHFGNGDLAAYDFDGKQLWRRNLQADYGDYSIWWGHANSPVLYEKLVISVCMQDSCSDQPGKPSPSYVVAHDKRSGRERWKKLRMTSATAESCDSYTTPIFRQGGKGLELIVMGGQMLDAYDPASGQQLWFLPNLTGNRTITGPVAAHGLIYVTQGMRQPLLAVKPGEKGQGSRKDIVWKFDQGTPDSPTPVVWGQWLFLVTNDGIARCLDAYTGRLHWKERLKGEYRASPAAGEGRIYFLSTKGLSTVVSAAERFDRLTENHLEDDTFASPAFSDGRLFIRGRKALYCIGK